MITRRFLTALLFLLLIILLHGCATKEPVKITLPQGRVAKIIYLLGDVSVQLPGEGWIDAEMGQSLPEGTRIKTEANSYCEIAISSGTIFRMKDKSELELIQLPENEKNNRSRIKLITGKLLTRILKIAYRSEDTITTSSVTLGVRGTEFLVHTQKDDYQEFTEVLVSKGRVNVWLNLEKYESRELPREARGIWRDLQGGVKVKQGSKLMIRMSTVKELNTLLGSLVGKEEAPSETIAELKEKAELVPQPLDESDIKRLKEMEGLSLSFEMGPTYYLSPNFDGVNDDLAFSTGKEGSTKVEGWRFVIVNGMGNVVKVIKNRFPQEQEKILIPQTITWNLVSDGGNILSDGNYSYEFYTAEHKKKEYLRIKGSLVVDATPPHLEVNSEETTFSPNGDGIKDTIAINIDAEQGINWTCTISTAEGIVVRTEDWEQVPPQVFEWDGKGENGKVLPDGVYNITISGQDKAGNVTVKAIRGITIDTRERSATVNINHPNFSPNGDGILDTVTFYPLLSDHSRIDTWDLIIQTEKGDTAARFRGRRYIPYEITWDGSPRNKNYDYPEDELSSGTYYYFLKVVYRSGVSTYSFKKGLLLDVDPPEINVQVSPIIFSPDGDGVDDTLSIKPIISDLSPIHNWKIMIYKQNGKLFKTFSGYGMPREEIKWDGVSDSGVLVDSGEDYYLIFEAMDAGYNKAQSGPVPFSIDILVIPTERGLKIRVSNIEFGFDTTTLQGEKTFTILDKIVEVLKKYKKYSVIIEGHTDSTGNPDYNLKLSTQRAEAVGRYLIQQGIEEDRFTYQGYGSEFPIDTNETPEGRARNRRVEFILLKK